MEYRGPGIAYTKKLNEVLGGGPTPDEQTVIDACAAGERAIFGGGLPSETADGPRIRAALIRHLLLGGCADARPHETGVRIMGAIIDGKLEFQACHTRLDLSLIKCRFTQPAMFRDCEIGAVYLEGSYLPGLDLHRAQIEASVFLRDEFHVAKCVDLGAAKIGGQLACDGGKFDRGLNGNKLVVGTDVFLRNGFSADAEVNLVGAQIGGQLSCVGGKFDGGLNGDSLVVGTDVFLRDKFSASAEVNLVGAQIGGQLDCGGGKFDGGLDGNKLVVGTDVFLRDKFSASAEVNLVGAQIGGQLACAGGQFDGGLDLDSASIKLAFFWRIVNWGKEPGGVPRLDLTEARVGVLADDRASWGAVKTLKLQGFRYGTIQSDMGVQDRLDWLAQKEERKLPEENLENYRRAWQEKSVFDRFDPQPYTQLAKVLADQGDRGGAALVQQKREILLRKSARKREVIRGFNGGRVSRLSTTLRLLPSDFFGLLFRAFFGYGYRPMYAFWWVAAIWVFALFLYGAAFAAGQMAPNSDVILTSAHWLASVAQYDACAAACTKPLQYWLDHMPEATDYETFKPYLYALDLFVPLDALGQENAWAPSKDRGTLGAIAYYARMPIQMAGWIITAVGAAVLTGLVGRKE